MIREALGAVADGRDLSAGQAAGAMAEIMDGGATDAQIGALIAALRVKGETPEEIAGMARAMRERSVRVDAPGDLVDTCGTGGDSSGSFNVSTAAAFVAAGAGARVAKHGNRAVSSASGSADALEALGAAIDLGPGEVARCIAETGFGFMFAQRYHPSMRRAAGPRREMGIRTVFNILGPLTNPAGARRQVIGVADPAAAPKMARVLALLGAERALVVHGAGGADEITLSGRTVVWELADGRVAERGVSASDLGLPETAAESVRVAGPDESARMIRGALSGDHGPARAVAVANASAALVAAGLAGSLADGAAMAARSVDSGAAARSLDAFVDLSRRLGGG